MGQRRTDLAMEAHALWRERAGSGRRLRGVRSERNRVEGYETHVVDVLDEQGAKELGKPRGRYITLELNGLLRREEDSFARAVRAVARPRRGRPWWSGWETGPSPPTWWVRWRWSTPW